MICPRWGISSIDSLEFILRICDTDSVPPASLSLRRRPQTASVRQLLALCHILWQQHGQYQLDEGSSEPTWPCLCAQLCRYDRSYLRLSVFFIPPSRFWICFEGVSSPRCGTLMQGKCHWFRCFLKIFLMIFWQFTDGLNLWRGCLLAVLSVKMEFWAGRSSSARGCWHDFCSLEHFCIWLGEGQKSALIRGLAFPYANPDLSQETPDEQF